MIFYLVLFCREKIKNKMLHGFVLGFDPGVFLVRFVIALFTVVFQAEVIPMKHTGQLYAPLVVFLENIYTSCTA